MTLGEGVGEVVAQDDWFIPAGSLDLVLAADGAYDQLGAKLTGDLAHHGGQDACGAVDEHSFPGLEVRDLIKREQGNGGVRHGSDRQSGIQIVQGEGDRGAGDGDLGVAAGGGTGQGDDRLALSQARHLLAQGADGAGDFQARNDRWFSAELTAAHQYVGQTDGRVGDIDTDLPRSRLGAFDVIKGQYVGVAEAGMVIARMSVLLRVGWSVGLGGRVDAVLGEDLLGDVQAVDGTRVSGVQGDVEQLTLGQSQSRGP